MAEILIVSSDIDAHSTMPVYEVLTRQKHDVTMYSTDRILTQQDKLVVEIKNDNASIKINDNNVSPDYIDAAWFRKPGSYVLNNVGLDRAKEVYIRNEIQIMHHAIWDLYPNELWLNAPVNIRNADSKLKQLVLASSLGFLTPKTLAGNSWSEAKNLSTTSDIIAKMIRGIISENEVLKAVYTTPLSSSDIVRISDHVNPFPGILQQRIEKTREWRITVVEDEVFAAAIYTDPEAKDDWRKLQSTSAVRFKKEKLNEDIAIKCIEFTKKLNLVFGAIDIIENDSGHYFLECNPNGQYHWLEAQLGLPISKAIADALIHIAKKTGTD